MDGYWLSRNYDCLITNNTLHVCTVHQQYQSTVQNKLAYKNGPQLMNVLHLVKNYD